MGRSNDTLIIVHITNAVVVTIGNKDFYVFFFVVINATYTTGFVQTGIECLVIFQHSSAISKPWKYFIIKWVDDFYFVIIGVRDGHDVFFWNEGYAQRVLQFGKLILAIHITKGMQIFRVLISAYQDARSR